MNIVPTPMVACPRPGYFPVSSDSPVTASDHALHTSRQIFRNRLADWVDRPASRSRPRGGAVHLLLTGALAELDGVPAPRGIRAAHGDAHGEAYVLTIDDDSATIRSTTVEGVHRGLTTLLQLAATSTAPGYVPCGTVVDSPRFAWRGLSVDVARILLGVDDLEKIIDLADLYKLNTLHLHLTDDAGWRLPVTGRPALTAGGPSYTRSDYERVIAYAAERFITVVPEVDMPGHSAAAIAAYPELGIPASNRFAAGTLDTHSDATWLFVEDVIRSLSELTPGRFIHVGGDEAFGLTSSEHAAFVERAARLIRAAGKEVVGWQEAARAQLPSGSVIQHWIEHDKLRGLVPTADAVHTGLEDRGIPIDLVHRILDESSGDLPAARQQNAWILLSPASVAYLDRRYAEPSSDPTQDADRARLGHPLYPPTLVRDSLEWEPDLVSDEIDPERITGIEAAVWGETTDSPDDVGLLLLPRLPLVATQGWSRSRLPWDEAMQRLPAHAPIWEAMSLSWFASAEIPW
ncbi:family 20 glycosylhydrolase [Streptomyces sp. NPDC058718]|uniref:family 20 glycosylhydrolase n=1 Tax=Streptomyces sp. NPDC058718 TaxID=3346610 RepID=UPI0036C7E8C7